MATPTAAYGLASLGIKMRHHQHKGLYIALKLGGAAVATAAATAAAYKAYAVLNEKAKKKLDEKQLVEELLHQNDYQKRLDMYIHATMKQMLSPSWTTLFAKR